MAVTPKSRGSRAPVSKKVPVSPVQVARGIPKRTEVLLAVRAGGRCEFGGCNKYLFQHSLTKKSGNFSEQAHVVAFSVKGPRGAGSTRPADVHSVENLMLLCAECHKEIDTRPTEYSRTLLEAYKEAHEERIQYLTGLGPDQRSTIVQLKSRIFGDAVDIPAPHIYTAISPRYPADPKGHIIDLTKIKSDDADEYYTLAKNEIRREVAKLYDDGLGVQSTQHISLFALAQIPLLMYLGRCLSNKIDTDFFQRHRTEADPWKWPEDGVPARYRVEEVVAGTDPTCVALKLSLSGPVSSDNLPSFIDSRYSIYEITLDNLPPGTDFLRKRADLQAFRLSYRSFLAELRGKRPAARMIHVFPAVPAPIAIACGHDLLPKVDPTLVVYDFVKTQGGYIKRIEVNEHDTK